MVTRWILQHFPSECREKKSERGMTTTMTIKHWVNKKKGRGRQEKYDEAKTRYRYRLNIDRLPSTLLGFRKGWCIVQQGGGKEVVTQQLVDCRLWSRCCYFHSRHEWRIQMNHPGSQRVDNKSMSCHDRIIIQVIDIDALLTSQDTPCCPANNIQGLNG